MKIAATTTTLNLIKFLNLSKNLQKEKKKIIKMDKKKQFLLRKMINRQHCLIFNKVNNLNKSKKIRMKIIIKWKVKKEKLFFRLLMI